MGECIDIRREGAIARVVMHRKGNNSIAEDLMAELGAAFTELGQDPAVRAIVLTSEYEKYFSVGADLTSLGSIDRDASDAVDQVVAFVMRLNQHYLAIERCPKPVVAAINGHALGGGSELALCCDFRIMVEDGRSKIGQTESALGIIPGAGGTQRLPTSSSRRGFPRPRPKPWAGSTRRWPPMSSGRRSTRSPASWREGRRWPSR